ncbi:hypothetical protein HOE425_331781 [Hoeflea sp. EC-HK425]|nr:hypothetical protein HOE425_331781 [Hoeflea sp. EC-HK425]
MSRPHRSLHASRTSSLGRPHQNNGSHGCARYTAATDAGQLLYVGAYNLKYPVSVHVQNACYLKIYRMR